MWPVPVRTSFSSLMSVLSRPGDMAPTFARTSAYAVAALVKEIAGAGNGCAAATASRSK